MGRPLVPVATYMMENIDRFRDRVNGDVSPGRLSDCAAAHFCLLDADGHPVEWIDGLAILVVELDKARRDGRFSPAVGGWINSLHSDSV